MNNRNAANSQSVRLVCLDFDGTIMCYDDPPTFDRVAIQVLNELGRAGVAWCTNSGRGIEDQLVILDRARDKGLDHLPAALLCSESRIFRRGAELYEPASPWNADILSLVGGLQREVKARIEPWLPGWIATYKDLIVHFGGHYTAFNLTPSEENAAAFYAGLCEVLQSVRDIAITRNGCWVNILPCQAGKGNILAEFGATMGLSAGDILAIGDHLNDLSMLDGRAASRFGCPSDATSEVRRQVDRCGGYVAEAPGPRGTVDIIRHFASLSTPSASPIAGKQAGTGIGS